MPSKKPPPKPSLSKGAVERYLREQAARIHTIDDNGDPINKAEALAQLLWSQALGYEKENIKTGEKQWVEPNRQAQMIVLERCDGKVGTTGDEDENKLNAPERISELATKRINQLTTKIKNEGAADDGGQSQPETD